MHPVNLIYQVIKTQEKHPAATSLGVCAVTGLEGDCVPRKELFGKSFTNIDKLAYPGSDMVSVDAYCVLKYKWERSSSWFCDGEIFERLKRVDVREKVLEKSMPDLWTAYATTSYKKHGALSSVVNTNSRRIWLFEMRLVDCSDMEKVNAWWNVLNMALRSGIGRSIIESLNCPTFVMQKVGVGCWLKFEKWARTKHKSGLYAFLTYLLPSQEELRLENEEQ